MSDRLTIRTLGGLAIAHNGVPVSGFDSRKVAALLVYLAATSRDHPREVLAEMLWEGRTQTQALANLRAVLTGLRQIFGDFVLITRQAAGMALDTSWELDAVAFEDHLTAGRLADALDVYQGDFLAGFYVDSPDFEDWATLERERLRFRATDALDSLIMRCLEEGSFADGIAHATRLLQMDPLREETHRHMMLLLASSGQRAAALAQYATCQDLLREELDVEPSESTTSLYEQVRAGKFAPHGSARQFETPHVVPRLVSQHNFRRQTTSFVGRENEIEVILDQVRDPACRLLTLVGPGGIGKTRLALAAAERMTEDFSDGVFEVELAALNKVETIVLAIAAAVDFRFYQSPDAPDVQLLRYLHDKTMLLVLDNFEHLLHGVGLVDSILSGASGVTILATSRELLKLRQEWVFPVQGLTVTSPDCPDVCDALRLFIARARQRLPGFTLEAHPQAVTEICQLVEGMPLAIELAAAWVGTLSVETIARELEGSLDLLETEAHDVPDRHRSIRAAFDPTWKRLSKPEQTAFIRLSVFRGGFTREAAREVAGASLRTLIALVEKSLVWFDAERARYNLHELLRQYGEEKLVASGQDRAVYSLHSLYYADFLYAREPALAGPRQPEALQEVDTELENILAGWHWAVSQRDIETIAESLEGLREYCSKRALWREGDRLFEQAIETIEAAGSLSEHEELILAELLARRFWCCKFSGLSDKSGRLREKGHALIRRLGPRPEIPFTLWVLWGEGDNDGHNIEAYQELLTIFRGFDNRWGMAASLLEIAHLTRQTADYAGAEQYYRQSLSIFREIGNQWWMVWPLMYLSWILTVHDQLEEASQLRNEALGLAESLHGPYATMFLHAAQAALFQGNLDEAEQLVIQGFAAGKKLGDQTSMRDYEFVRARIHTSRGDGATACKVLEGIRNSTPPPHADYDLLCLAIEESHAQLALGNTDKSRDGWRQALQMWLERDELRRRVEFLIDILVGVASVLVLEGRLETAAELLAFTTARTSIFKRVKEEARLLQEVERALHPQTFAAAWQRGQSLTLDAAVALARKTM